MALDMFVNILDDDKHVQILIFSGLIELGFCSD